MRRFPPMLLMLLAAACASKPPTKAAAPLKPLGPCPTSSWQPEAPPPTASAKTSMVLLAVQEWARYGRQVITYQAKGETSLENLDRGPGHCDIVVEVRTGEVHAIGGNVGDSVTRSVFPLDGSGFLSPISARRFFTVIENRLP